MSFTVRPLEEADHDGWLAAWRAFRAGIDEKPLADDVVKTAWARFMAPEIPMHAVGAFRDGALSGFVHYLFHYSAGSIALACYLQTLYTAPEARGQGMGRALIEAVYDAARKAGSHRVYWQMHANNTSARGLYDKIAERTDFIQYRKPL